MAANVEIKARVRDLETLEKKAAQIADRGPEILIQDDIFFSTPKGRFKLRAFPDGRGELIYYERPDVKGPKLASYSIFHTTDVGRLKRVLTSALAVVGRVRKERRLYRAGPTRIHLDRVKGLGSFVELEVVLRPGEDESEGVAIAKELMRSLDIPEEELVDGAYVDLLARTGENSANAIDDDDLSW